MKNIFLFIFSFLLLVGCSEKKTGSLIQGTWNRGKVEKLYLFQVQEGSLKSLLSAVPDEEGHFTFDFEPAYEGFYVIGLQSTSALNNYTFYLKPGDDLQFVVDTEGYHLTGENTPENKVLEKWEEYIYPVRDGSFNYLQNKITYVDFFPLLEQKFAGISSFEANGTKNRKFNEAFKKYKDYDFLHDALFFLFTPRTVFHTPDELISYYKEMNLPDITRTEDILSYPYGMSVVNLAGLAAMGNYIQSLPQEEQAAARKEITPIPFVIPMIGNDKIKGGFLNMNIVRITSEEKVQQIYKEYGQYLVTDAQKETFQKYMDGLNKTAAGNPAIDFKFPDMDGNEIALSDFKGKVVYVDIWATWCGPCKKEIPHLKDLEKEYQGKDIVFMSVSTDAQKDYEKWKQMVIDEELRGVQLFAGDRSRDDIINPYRIKGIPRFLLIDKNGNILSNDAERPSSADIRKILDEAIM